MCHDDAEKLPGVKCAVGVAGDEAPVNALATGVAGVPGDAVSPELDSNSGMLPCISGEVESACYCLGVLTSTSP